MWNRSGIYPRPRPASVFAYKNWITFSLLDLYILKAKGGYVEKNGLFSPRDFKLSELRGPVYDKQPVLIQAVISSC